MYFLSPAKSKFLLLIHGKPQLLELTRIYLQKYLYYKPRQTEHNQDERKAPLNLANLLGKHKPSEEIVADSYQPNTFRESRVLGLWSSTPSTQIQHGAGGWCCLVQSHYFALGDCKNQGWKTCPHSPQPRSRSFFHPGLFSSTRSQPYLTRHTYPFQLHRCRISSHAFKTGGLNITEWHYCCFLLQEILLLSHLYKCHTVTKFLYVTLLKSR